MFRSWDEATVGYVDALRADEDLRAAFNDSADLGVAEQVGKLLEVARQQSVRIAELELGVEVLTLLLVERGGLDLMELRNRYQALKTAQASAAPANEVPCAACGRRVQRRDTFRTSRGTVCAACHGE